MPMLHFPPKVHRNGPVTVITFTGIRNRGVENAFANELKGQTDGLRDCHLFLDFINMEFITAAELGKLVTLYRGLTASCLRLTLFNLNAHVNEVFAITKLNTLFEIQSSRDSFASP